MAQGRRGIGHNGQRPVPDPPSGRRARNEMSVVSFEDSDVVRSAIRVEGFRDDEFNYQLIRALGVADYGGSTVGECLSVATEIADGSPSSWAGAFERLAQRTEDRGRACLEAGHRVSGRDHYLRASTYYRTAEYYADGVGGRSHETGERSRSCFAVAAGLVDPPVELVEVPFEGGSLPGYLVRPAGPGAAPAPPDPGRGGRLRLERRGAVLPPGRTRGRAGMERLRLRRARPARVHAPQPEPDLPARLRGSDRRGARHPRAASTTSTGTAWSWPVRASARTSPPAARPPTPGYGPWWRTRRWWTWAGTWRPGWGPTSSVWPVTSDPRTSSACPRT